MMQIQPIIRTEITTETQVTETQHEVVLPAVVEPPMMPLQ